MLDHMEIVLREIGVEHFTLIRLTPELDTIDETTIGTRGHREWYDNYFHRDNPDRDPLIIHAKQTVEPFFALDHITNPRRLEHIARLQAEGRVGNSGAWAARSFWCRLGDWRAEVPGEL